MSRHLEQATELLDAWRDENAVVVEPLSSSAPPWPTLSAGARHGLAGDFVEAVEPHTESDPVALLIGFLVAFGSAVGRTAHVAVEASRHYANLFAVMVGASSRGRKGTSWAHVERSVAAASPGWRDRVVHGLSSGEGLIWAVRDPIWKRNRQGVEERVDDGVDDKRLLVVESEFATVLKMAEREGNTLSATIRNAWDRGDLSTLTKNSPAKATDAHVSLVGHVTKDELLRYLTATESANGWGNRHLWACVRRSQLLPFGGQPPDLESIATDLRVAIEQARGLGEVRLSRGARELWAGVYPDLTMDRCGLLGAMTARAEAQTIRLALVYALLDRSGAIGTAHLGAALALWDYCEASAAYIFGDSLGDSDADELLRALLESPVGLTRNEIRDLFGRNRSSGRISDLLRKLSEAGMVAGTRESGPVGRPAERWRATGRGIRGIRGNPPAAAPEPPVSAFSASIACAPECREPGCDDEDLPAPSTAFPPASDLRPGALHPPREQHGREEAAGPHEATTRSPADGPGGGARPGLPPRAA